MFICRTILAALTVFLCAAHVGRAIAVADIEVACKGCGARAFARVFVPAKKKRMFRWVEEDGACSCTRDDHGRVARGCRKIRNCSITFRYTEPGVPGKTNCIHYSTNWPPTKPPNCNPKGAPITATLTVRVCDGKDHYWAFWQNSVKLLEIHGVCAVCSKKCPDVRAEPTVVATPR